MRSLRRALLKAVALVPLVIVVSILVIGGLGTVSLSSATRIGVHFIHSFWPCIPAAVCFQLVRIRANASLVAFSSAFLFLVLVNVAVVLSYISGYMRIVAAMPISNQSMDILDTTLTGLILSIAFLPKSSQKECSPRDSTIRILLLTSILLILYTGAWFLLLATASSEIATIVGFLFGIIGTLIFAFLTVVVLNRRIDFISIDQGYFGSATLLTALSLLLFMSSIATATDIWVYAENLQVAALMLYGLSLAIPYLRGLGVGHLLSYTLILGFSVLTCLPLTIVIFIEAAVMILNVNPSNLIASGIVHLGASFLSGMIAILLYSYSRRKSTDSLHPLTLLYVLWTFVAISSVLGEVFQVVAATGEPIVSYIVGSLLTLVILLHTWLKPQSRSAENDSHSPRAVVTATFALGLLVLTGELVNILVMTVAPETANLQIGNGLLFAANVLVLLILLSLFFTLVTRARGRATIEICMLLFLSVWIVPNILKSYYVNWSAGWWVSQLMVFMGLLVGPALLGHLYIRALRETEESHMRARLYADLLMHDVSNYHQMLLTSLELIEDDARNSDRRRKLSKEARKVVSLADQLISNVRVMAQTEETTPTKLKSMNLVSLVVSALNEVMENMGSEAIEFRYMSETDYAPIMGDEMLKHAFINIFLLALQQPLKTNQIVVGISEEQLGDKSWWRTTLVVPGECTEYKKMVQQIRMERDGYSGIKLNMLVLHLIIASLGGRLILHTADEEHPSTEFEVLLPSQEASV